MPKNPSSFIQQLRQTEEELKVQSQMYYLGEATIKPPKLRKNTRMFELCSKVYNAFVDESTQAGKTRPLPAVVVEGMLAGSSRTTINKLKKILGIRSIRREGKWYWSFPRRAPDQARQAMHQRLIKDQNTYQEELDKLSRPAAQALKVIMEENNYQLRNEAAIHLMSLEGYSRSTTLKAKAIVGVISKKINGVWLWLFPDVPVVEWLEAKLAQGPVSHKRIELEAWQEHQWEWELINIARRVAGGITWTYRDGEGFLTSVNKHLPPPPVDNSIVIDNTPLADGEREVIVDFTIDPDEGIEELVEEDELPAPREVTVTGTSVKLEIFE